VPLAVDREILRNLDLGIGAALLKDLGLSSDNGAQICKEFLQEPINIVDLRDALQNKRDRLSNGVNSRKLQLYVADICFAAKRQLMTLSVM
jgi:hypothetical protein